MKLFLNKKIFKGSIFVTLLFMSTLTYGFQDCSDPLNPNPDFPDCDPDIYVPIDDGVYFIMIAGIIMGYTLLKQKKTIEGPSA